MALRVADLLADRELGLELVAGGRGLEERGLIRWAHISELPDPTPWLEGGEVLLLTGLGVRDREDLQRSLVAGLDRCGCAGIGFGVGIWVDAVPPALIAECDERRLPLFTVPYETPFLAVTKKVSQAIAADHYAALRSAVDLHRAMLAAVVGGRGVEAVLGTAAAAMPDFAALVLDAYGQLLARHDPSGVARDLDHATLWRTIVPHPPPYRFTEQAGGLAVTGSAIRVGDEVEAILLLVGGRPLREQETLLLEQAVAGITLELARGASAREVRRTRLEDLLSDAEQPSGHHPLERGLERLGFALERGYHVLCLRLPRHVSERALCALAEDVLAAEGPPLVARAAGHVYCVVQPGDSDAGERLANMARARLWRGLRVGRSRPVAHLSDLGPALREAAAAAAHAGGDGVQDITALGMAGLISALRSDPISSAFLSQVLGPILAHDAREPATLISTLRAYLRHGCRPGPAAAELRVHRHTLAYRLDRIRELTGRDPRDGTNLLEFGLALELLQSS